MFKFSLSSLFLAIALASFSSTQKIHQPKLTSQNSGTTQGLIAVSPVNPRVVWASGRGGTFVIAGAMPGLRSDKNAVISAAPMYLVNKEISILGTRYATRTEIARSLELVRDGKVKPMIGASFPLEQAEEALEAIRRNQVFGRILIDCAA